MSQIFLGVDPWGLPFFLDDIPLYDGDLVEVQRNGVWIRGRFECWQEEDMLKGHVSIMRCVRAEQVYIPWHTANCRWVLMT